MSLPVKITLTTTDGMPPSNGFTYVDYDPQLTATAWSLHDVCGAVPRSPPAFEVVGHLGYGVHNWDIAPENFDDVLLYLYAAGILWFIIGSVILVLGSNATIHWVQCWPLEMLWHLQEEGSCIPKNIIIDYNVFAAAYSDAAGIALALFPWVITWASTISKKEKLGVVVSMSMGVFAGVASLLKITTVTAIDSNDFIDNVELLIYGTAESANKIMAVSIPMLRALLHTPKAKSP